MQMDESLKQLMTQLGAAINDVLKDSEAISKAIQDIRDAGYDVFLVLEATIGFNKRSADATGGMAASGLPKAAISPGSAVSGQLKLTAQDLKFCQSMKISTEDIETS